MNVMLGGNIIESIEYKRQVDEAGNTTHTITASARPYTAAEQVAMDDVPNGEGKYRDVPDSSYALLAVDQHLRRGLW